MRTLDEALLFWINGVRTPLCDALARWLSEWGLYVLPTCCVVWALYTRSRTHAARARDAVLVYFTALFLAETLVKPIVARPRPSSIVALATRVHLLGARPSAQSYSFPSGTATTCAAVAVWVWLAWGPRAGLAASAFAVSLAWSRLYAGVHWPSDLIAGAILGGAVAHAVWALGRWIDAAPRSSS